MNRQAVLDFVNSDDPNVFLARFGGENKLFKTIIEGKECSFIRNRVSGGVDVFCDEWARMVILKNRWVFIRQG